MQLKIPYSKGKMTIDVPDKNFLGVLESHPEGKEQPGTQAEIVERALDNVIGSPKLEELVRGKKRMVIITSDHTRPVPSRVTMPILLRRIREANPEIDISILIATGFHRATTHEELVDRFGEDIVKNEKIIIHDSQDDAAMADLGLLPSGGKLLINRAAIEASSSLAKEKGAFIYGICNVVGSSIARITDSGTYTHAGPEIGVASTKAFTTQLTVLTLIALHLGHKKGTISDETYQRLCEDLGKIPSLLEVTLNKVHDNVKAIAESYKHAANCLYLGRGFNFPTALEGALKLKEISYIHAEGYPAAEMKHGPIALIDENMPVIFIAPNKGHYDKVVSNAQEIKARKGKIIAVVTEGDTQMAGLANHVIEIPEISEALTPILASVPLQLLSYYIAIKRGCNVDQPRNLAKSVTVE